MHDKKIIRNRGETILAIVKREMAKPRIVKSAREAELNLAASRNARGKPRKSEL
jgi:hypothetical protein